MSSEYNDNNQDLIAKKLQYRNKKWEMIIKQQFQLAYFGKIGFEVSQHLTVFEREFLFNLLIEQKTNERKEAEKVAKANAAKAKANRSRTRRHR